MPIINNILSYNNVKLNQTLLPENLHHSLQYFKLRNRLHTSLLGKVTHEAQQLV